MRCGYHLLYSFFFFNDTATTEIYTLSLHDALPISSQCHERGAGKRAAVRRNAAPAEGDRAARRRAGGDQPHTGGQDRKSTRLNSSHSQISYAVFCLKKKTNEQLLQLLHT